jgi:hypothetical protein
VVEVEMDLIQLQQELLIQEEEEAVEQIQLQVDLQVLILANQEVQESLLLEPQVELHLTYLQAQIQ